MDFEKNSEKVRKKLVAGVKRVQETQKKTGARTHEWPDEEAIFIGRAEDEMVVGTIGQVHGGLGGEFRGNELRTR